MLFGLIVRTGTLVINAGLMFLLAQQAPQLDWADAYPKSGMLDGYRDNILSGLARVHADLEANGRLLFPIRGRTEGPAKAQVKKLILLKNWSEREDSNLRPLRPERSALPG